MMNPQQTGGGRTHLGDLVRKMTIQFFAAKIGTTGRKFDLDLLTQKRICEEKTWKTIKETKTLLVSDFY